MRGALLTATWAAMITRDQLREFRRSRFARSMLFAAGILLLILSPIIGAIPGPGGLFVFAAGMALTLQNSDWAKRRYVHFKRWQPKAGAWMDWGLRRKSAKRREELRKQRHGKDKDLGAREGQAN